MDIAAPVDPPRRRRRSADIRRDLIARAQHLFDTKGYAATTMTDISAESGVALSVLYRHFPSKADLLREAVLIPFVSFIDSFGEVWQAQLESPIDEPLLIRAFLAQLYESLSEHRGALLTLVTARDDLDEDIDRQIARAMRRMFLELRHIGEAESATRGWFSPEQVELSVRLIVAMVTGAAVFGELLLPKDLLGSDELFSHAGDLVLWGLSRNRPSRGDSAQPY